MADISVGWEVEGVMSPEESVKSMLEVIDASSIKDTGKFLTWQGKVRLVDADGSTLFADKARSIHGEVLAVLVSIDTVRPCLRMPYYPTVCLVWEYPLVDMSHGWSFSG